NFKLAYRNFLKYKSSFLINLIGLTSGLTCFFLIALWINDELNVNKFHAKDDQIYQIYMHHEESGKLRSGPAIPSLLPETLEEEYPEVIMGVEDTETNWFANNFALSNGKEMIKAPGKFGGKGYFSLFSYPLRHGDPAQVFDDKNSIVISEGLAVKLFGTTENVIGKSLSWHLLDDTGDVTVTGIMQTLPNASTETFEFAIPFQNFNDLLGDGVHWGNYTAYGFVELAEGTDVDAFNEKIAGLIKEKRPGINVTPFVTKYSDLYLRGDFDNGKIVGGRILYVKLFTAIALFILVIACINFMNLSTARAARRLKEIGVKKSLGASRKSLINQFLTESFMIATLATILAAGFVIALLPYFNQLTGKLLSIQITPQVIFMIVGIAASTGLLAGSYPALYLSGFKPIQIIKGKLTSSFGELWTRKGLVVFQFTLSIVMIVGVLVVYKQLEYIQSKNLGIKRENVLKLPVEGRILENMKTFITEVESIPGVVSASTSSHNFMKSTNSTTGVHWEGKDPDVQILFEQARSYYGLIETLGIELVAGRDFSEEYADENSKIIFNETAIEVMELEDPIGQTVKLWGKDKVIVGVAKDFIYSTLHEKVQPMLFHYDTEFLPNAFIKVKSENMSETLESLKSFYADFNPGYTLDYEFLDQNYYAQYLSEKRISSLSQVFAVVAIIISCLGLFGLAAFTAERREKEIGIRKILGAKHFSIVKLLSGDFTKMVLAAIIIALPLSYFVAEYWLTNFAYRITLSWIFFAAAGLTALFIAWLTVSIQTIKAARVNPINCLKDD
ncbi:FtsX-like permease family protein, partial [Fulvivirga sp. RKSG066]|uniref:FtsX-like permease family protein n=1 Tax=Fulvivirga aurantia TaxID=2529383 RepID=UPI0012BB849B